MRVFCIAVLIAACRPAPPASPYILRVAVAGTLERMSGAIDMRSWASIAQPGVFEHLVSTGVPFKEAHETVGKLVAEAISRSVPLREVADTLGPDIAGVLDARTSVDKRNAPGPSASSVDAQLSHLDASLKQIRDALG